MEKRQKDIEKRYRKCYLNAKAEITLKEYIDSREDINEPLFVRSRKPHDRMSKSGIELTVDRIMSRCSDEINKKVTPHVFRHTMATTALQNGMNIVEVYKLLGHVNVMTAQKYVSYATLDIKTNHRKKVI